MYYLTGVQHTKDGDFAIATQGYEDRDGYLAKYHQEMSYAMQMDNFLGLCILVFDGSGNIVLNDNWVKEIPYVAPEPQPIEEPIEQPEPTPEENTSEDETPTPKETPTEE